MPRTIVVTSGKGGVGKTTVAANLGIALAKQKQNVILIDLDVGLNNLDLALSMETHILFDLSDCLSGKCRLGQAIVSHPKCPNLFILGCNNSETKLLIENNIERVIEKLKAHFDFIIIDSPAGMDSGFVCATACAEEALVVVTPHLASLRDSDKVLEFLHSKNSTQIGLVVNRVRGDLVAGGNMLSPAQIEKALKEPIKGIIPESDLLCVFSNYLKSTQSDEAKAFGVLAKNIMCDSFTKFDCTQKYRGVLGLLRRAIRSKA